MIPVIFLWRIQDIIDLEYFFSHVRSEEENGDAGAALQERQIFLNTIQPQLHNQIKPSRQSILKLWLDFRRQYEQRRTDSPVFLPGSAYVTAQRVLSYGLVLVSFLAGVNLAAYFLKYNGTEPVNVFLYISVLVLFQVILSIVAGAALFFNWLGVSFIRKSPLYSLLGLLAGRLLSWIRKKTIRTLSADQRHGSEAVLGLISGKRTIYGTLFFWPLFVLFQISGVCFNIGAVSITLIKVITTDLAFGWQSTLQLSSEAIYTLVSTVALPWSWLVSAGTAHPSLVQVEGSRMILKDGLYHLATGNLVAWWPFLVLSVACYGLLPRVLFLMAGLSLQQRALDRLDFSHSDCDRLFNRLTTALVSTKRSTSSDGFEKNRVIHPAEVHLRPLANTEAVALIPDDIFAGFPLEEFTDLAQMHLALNVKSVFPVKNQDKTLGQVDQMCQEGEGVTLLILFEGWQPPIQEDLSFLRKVRRHVLEKTPIIVVMIGRPTSGATLTPLSDLDWNIWNKKIAVLGDPYLRIERLVPGNEE